MNVRKRKILQSKFQHNSDPDTQEPIIVPLNSLQDVDKWQDGCDEFCKASKPISLTKCMLKDSSKTLICHDMMNGYHDDRFVQGVHKDDITSYCFYNWQYIDIFIYFSHSFITIPPPGWINAAHKHGTKVLGTIITEWEGGEIIWESILKTKESYQSFADKVVSIAKYYGFDGWLINIECKVEKCQVNNLVMFLQYLTNSIHTSINNSQIIWYDSILQDGTLLWQDCLNEMNECFFFVSDGIFLNYNWTSDKLQNSYQRSGNRHWDVYVGVDIWGRSGKNQEGFDAHIAVKECLQNDLSIALFAPAWTYEYKGKEDFCRNENQFWYTLAKVFKCSRGPNKLPFVTSFCEGQGEKMYQEGKIISQRPWFNLSCQQNQLSFRRYHPTDYSITRRENVWQMYAKTSTSTKSVDFRLYHCNIEITEPYFILYSFQLLQDTSDVNLELTFYNQNRSNKDVIVLTLSQLISKDGHIAIEQIEDDSQLLCCGVDSKLNKDYITRIFLIKPTLINGVIKVLERVSVRVQLALDSLGKHVNLLLNEVKVLRASDGCDKSLQEIVCQPEEDCLSVISWPKIAYDGGNCLKLSGLFTGHLLKFKLFECDFEMSSPILVTYTYNVIQDIDVALDLTFQSSHLKELVRLQDNNKLLEEGIVTRSPVKKEDLPALFKYGINPERDYQLGWITRAFTLQMESTTLLQEVTLTCGLSSAVSNVKIDILLGQIRVVPLTDDVDGKIEDCDFFELSIDFSKENFNLLTCILSWSCNALTEWFNIFYNVCIEEKPLFLGLTHNKLYKVCNLKINKDCELEFVSFFIQPMSTYGMPLPWQQIKVPIK